jgi:hypothetical protein
MVTPGGQTPNFLPEISQNITIIPIWTFDNTKITAKSKFETKPDTISSK